MASSGLTFHRFRPYLGHGQELICGDPVPAMPVAMRRLRRLQAHLQSQLLDERDRMARQLPLLIPAGNEADADVATVLVPHLMSVQWKEVSYMREAPTFVLDIVGEREYESRIPPRLDIYQRIGVTECWIVYEEKRLLERRILLEGTYMDPHEFAFGDPVASIVFPGMLLDWREAGLV